jgi:hypothetical protein
MVGTLSGCFSYNYLGGFLGFSASFSTFSSSFPFRSSIGNGKQQTSRRAYC